MLKQSQNASKDKTKCTALVLCTQHYQIQIVLHKFTVGEANGFCWLDKKKVTAETCMGHLLSFSNFFPKEYAGFMCFEKSCFVNPHVEGNPYLPGPGPDIVEEMKNIK